MIRQALCLANDMRTLYIIACIFLALAIVLQVIALGAASRGARAIASDAQRRAESDESPDEQVYAEAHAFARTSGAVTGASLLVALAGMGLCCCSFARGYRRLTVIPVVLLVTYVAVLLVQV